MKTWKEALLVEYNILANRARYSLLSKATAGQLFSTALQAGPILLHCMTPTAEQEDFIESSLI